MLLVDSQRRASLEEVASHQWLQEGGEEAEMEATLPVISNVDEIPKQDLEVILRRMEQGGYGSVEAILRYLGMGSSGTGVHLVACSIMRGD